LRLAGSTATAKLQIDGGVSISRPVNVRNNGTVGSGGAGRPIGRAAYLRREIQLGHGRDYAWSATTATSDNVDTFAEVLCKDAFHYRYRGRCLAMDKLQRANSWTPNGVDMTSPGSETLTAYRTVHGIVYARGTVGGRKVAFLRPIRAYAARHRRYGA